MNYFELFGIPVSLQIDPSRLRRRYYELSRQYHPDMHTQSGADPAAILEQAALLNTAFKVLGDERQLLRYVLELKGLLAEEEKYQLSQLFLMELMDINEKLIELEFDPDEEAIADLHRQVLAMEQELLEEIQPIMHAYKDADAPSAALEKLKEFYFKQKYLLRIQEKLSTFASRD